MPADYSRMIRITLCQFCVDRSNLLTVYRGSITMVVTETMQIADTLLGYAEHFRVLRGHPSRSGATWCSEECIDTVCCKTIQNLIQPFERVYTLFRLKGHPREDTNGHHVTLGKLHQANIFFQHFR